MPNFTRRDFLKQTTCAATVLATTTPGFLTAAGRQEPAPAPIALV